MRLSGLNMHTLARKIREVEIGTLLSALIIMAILTYFIVLPIFYVFIGAFSTSKGFGLDNFILYFNMPSMREGLMNALLAGVLTTIFTSLVGVTAAFIVSRYDFRGKSFFQNLSVLPLVIPPFVGAFAMIYMMGRNGLITRLINYALKSIGINPYTIGIGYGLLKPNLWSLVFIQSIHLWPIIYLNVLASLSRLDPSLEESARVLGAHGFYLFRKVLFPLVFPGYVAGAVIVFLWSISDIGTPIMLGFLKFAPYQAFAELVVYMGDVEYSYVICFILVVLTTVVLLVSSRIVGLKEYATARAGAVRGEIVRKVGLKGHILIFTFFIIVLILSLIPHIGIILVSFTEIPRYGELFPSKFTLRFMSAILTDIRYAIAPINSLIYSLLAMIIDILIGLSIAYLLVRKRFPGQRLLDLIAMMPLVIPGIVIAIGYLRQFSEPIPGIGRLTTFWFILVISYSMRRLPYSVRACEAILRQIHVEMEEAALSVGASRIKIIFKVLIPLMLPGVLAGGLLSFVTAFTEVSSSLILYPLVPPITEHARPLTLEIYLMVQRGVTEAFGYAGCLGLIQIIVVAIVFYISNRLLKGRLGVAFGG